MRASAGACVCCMHMAAAPAWLAVSVAATGKVERTERVVWRKIIACQEVIIEHVVFRSIHMHSSVFLLSKPQIHAAYKSMFSCMRMFSTTNKNNSRHL